MRTTAEQLQRYTEEANRCLAPETVIVAAMARDFKTMRMPGQPLRSWFVALTIADARVFKPDFFLRRKSWFANEIGRYPLAAVHWRGSSPIELRFPDGRRLFLPGATWPHVGHTLTQCCPRLT